jgi:hypothetical protein
MKLPFELVRPLCFFDLETTGLDVKNDRIVELALIKVTPQGDVLERVRRYNPGLPIPPEATAVHGITDDDVADEHPFCRTARSLDDELLAVEDVLHVEYPTAVESEANVTALELRDEHVQIEAPNVEPA